MGPQKNKENEENETEDEESKTSVIEPEEKTSLRDWENNNFKNESAYGRQPQMEMNNMVMSPNNPRESKQLIGNIDEDKITDFKKNV